MVINILRNVFKWIGYFAIYFTLSTDLFAQSAISSYEIEQIKNQSLKIVGDFNDFLNRIASKDDVDEPNKNLLIDRAIKYFLDSSSVEVSNKITGKITTYEISKYLTNIVLKYKQRYAVVQFEAIPIKGAHLKPIFSGNKIIGYDGTVNYRQIFRVERFDSLARIKEIPTADNYVYFDQTEKQAIVYIRKREATSGRKIWFIKLGDITVVNTTD